MLRKDDAEYEFGRSTALLKVKTFHDEEGTFHYQSTRFSSKAFSSVISAKVISYMYNSANEKGIRHIRCLLPNGIDFSIGNTQ